MILYLIIVLLVFATMIGLLMISMQLQKEIVSNTIMYAHLALAGTSLLVLAIYSYLNPTNYPKLSLLLLSLAAVMGLFMFYNFKQRKHNPYIVDILYGVLALGGFINLVMFVF